MALIDSACTCGRLVTVETGQNATNQQVGITLSEKANPNPLCLSCGKHTRTLSRHITNGVGSVIQRRFITECSSVQCKDGVKFSGRGETLKAARADYGRKLDDDFNDIKQLGKPND